MLLSICDFVKISEMEAILGGWGVGAQMTYLRVYRDNDTLKVMNTVFQVAVIRHGLHYLLSFLYTAFQA